MWLAQSTRERQRTFCMALYHTWYIANVKARASGVEVYFGYDSAGEEDELASMSSDQGFTWDEAQITSRKREHDFHDGGRMKMVRVSEIRIAQYGGMHGGVFCG